ncbi:MAG: class I SAM-dependent methyltransferase [Chloroflexi bacterium]|nr:class I SAM-dependent methyltransferase [Chloroflexota bacterium]MCI0576947.1 class I SAM-dependent methyltransferase [Chloroflexota bacterium]MCI0644779.1 class I SAM-dependent methyltransferase [Chloroflexota bacterium]MCI0729250.1 class I SAM-dependent methyltransferase [Chloroflexota bacterium]
MLKSNRLLSKEKARGLDLSTRVALEARITDRRSQIIEFEQFTRKQVDLEWFTASRPWRQHLINFLGPFEGKVMLDLACGYSMTPVMFALAGAIVYALDVAPKTLATVKRFARFKAVGDSVQPVVAAGEYLPFATESFDLIFGNAALHHLQLEQAAPEIVRVLKQGGKAAFQDPLGQNPFLELARDYLPYEDKHPEKGTDHPLRIQDVERFNRYFTTSTYQTFHLTGMLGKPLHLPRNSPFRRRLEAFDSVLFRHIPYMQRYARFVVTCVSK